MIPKYFSFGVKYHVPNRKQAAPLNDEDSCGVVVIPDSVSFGETNTADRPENQGGGNFSGEFGKATLKRCD